MKPVIGRITTTFAEPRPLSKPPELRNHCHGAIDIAAPVGTPIHCPETGTVWAWCAFRDKFDTLWPEMPEPNDYANPWCNYFYDTFGTILLVHSQDGKRTHIIAHSFCNQIFNKGIFKRTEYIEEKGDTRFPLHALYTPQQQFPEGALVGYVGNAGYSTGAHCHWEIHHGVQWNIWENRINPERWEV